ncbi:helix-turn-helix domain-containing protein [Actinopolymorpha pittospori]
MSLGVVSLKELADPVRLRIVSLVTGAALSADEIARELDISPAVASSHVRALVAADHLVEVGEETEEAEEPQGVASRYLHVPGLQPAQDAGDSEIQTLVYQAMAQELARRGRHCAPTQHLPRLHTDAELWVDPEDWARAVALVREAADLLFRRAHPPRTQGTVHVDATLAMFGMTDETSGAQECEESRLDVVIGRDGAAQPKRTARGSLR